jgi:site-specific DNA recombinase
VTRPLDPPLVPRDGVTLRALGVYRIPSTDQVPQSPAEPERPYRRFLQDRYPEAMDIRVVALGGPGEKIGRPELAEVESLLARRAYDLVLIEDMGPICRPAMAYLVCEVCTEHGTRLIDIANHVDTGRDGWQKNALFDALNYGTSMSSVSRRLSRTKARQFEQGGCLKIVAYGYIKPPGARTDADLRKDPAAAPVYDEWFRRLESGEGYQAVADWLNGSGVPTGQYCRSDRWEARLVRSVTGNPILKGIRVFNSKMHRRVNGTRPRETAQVPAATCLVRHVPHLAFIEAERYDRILALLARRSAQVLEKQLRSRRERSDRDA